MYRYSSYIIRNLAGSAILITASLTSIVWLTQALRHIDFIINRGVSFGTFLYLSSLLIPSLLLLILPIGLFCGVLFTYNKLINDSEMIVLKSAGLSRWQLAKPALLIAVGSTMFGYAISLYFLPATYREFKDMQSFLRNNYASLLLQEEVFNTPVDGLTVFIREREQNGILKGILVHDTRIPNSPVTMMAQEGKLVQTGKGPRFILGHGNRQEIRDHRLSLLNFDSYTLDISFYTAHTESRVREPAERYLNELFDPARLSDKEIVEMHAEAHQRLSWPFYSIVLTLIALSFLLTGDFNRRGQWKRVSLAVGVGSIAVLSAQALTNAVGKHASTWPLLYISLGVFSLCALYALLNEYNRKARPNPLAENRA